MIANIRFQFIPIYLTNIWFPIYAFMCHTYMITNIWFTFIPTYDFATYTYMITNIWFTFIPIYDLSYAHI